MAKKKFPYILIKDAKSGFRVHLVGGNGEKLMKSEVLESVQAVRKNIVGAWYATVNKIAQDGFDKSVLNGKWVKHLNLKYEGKSDAIYKAFGIEKPNNNQ